MSSDQLVTSSSAGKKTFLSKIRNVSFGRSRAYLFEYGLLLILTVALINILGMMFQEVIGKQASFIQDSLYLFMPYGFTDVTFELFAAFLIVFPAVIILIQRTASAERHDPNIKNIGWRKGLLNLFLAISALWAVVSLVSVLAGALEYVSLASLTDITYDWREALENIFKATLLLLAVWAFSSDYRNVIGEKTAKVMHLYRYTILLSGLILAILFVIFPFMDNRKEIVDQKISNDLFSIEGSISSKYYVDYNLPSDLDDLDLNDEQKDRAKEHNYKYEKVSENAYKLCATFLGDSKGYGNDNGYGADLAIYPPISGEDDYFDHGKGEKCFEKSVDDYGIYSGAEQGQDLKEDSLVSDPAMYDLYSDPEAGTDQGITTQEFEL